MVEYVLKSFDFSYLDFVYATHLFCECQSMTLIIGDTYWPAQLYSRRYFLKMTDRLTVCQKGEDMWLEGLESMTSVTFPKNRHSAWPKFIKSFWNCFLKYWQKKGKILKKKNKITHTHTHSHAKSNMSIWLNILT